MAIRMIGHKQGVFLTFIALVMLGALTVFFTSTYIPTDLNEGTHFRIEKLNELVSDLESSYFVQIIDSSGTRALISLVEYIKLQDEFLVDFESVFAEVIENGTIGGTDIDTITGFDLMANNTLQDRIGILQTIVDRSFVTTTTIGINSITPYQVEPWSLWVDVNFSLRVASESAIWDRNFTVTASIPIDRFEDPYLINHSNNAIVQRFNRTPTLSTGWNYTNVPTHIAFGTYVHFEDSEAPSFIQRFEGVHGSSSCCGIETLLDPNVVGNTVQSYADYLFYSENYTNCADLFNVTQWDPTYEGLKFETEHIFLYNVPASGYESLC